MINLAMLGNFNINRHTDDPSLMALHAHNCASRLDATPSRLLKTRKGRHHIYSYINYQPDTKQIHQHQLPYYSKLITSQRES